MKMKFNYPKRYTDDEHINILAMPKAEYLGYDLFKRSEFRGMLLADYQEAVGPKAGEIVQ